MAEIDDEYLNAPFAEIPPHVPTLDRTTRLFYILALIAGLWFAVFIVNPANRGDTIPWVMLVVGELILISFSIGSIWTILAGDRVEPDPAVTRAADRLANGEWDPSVDVLVTIYGEPIELVEATAIAARDMHGAHRTILCDDGDSDEVRELAQRLGVDYLARDENVNAKAGNINHALAQSAAEFVAIFDADHVAHPDFLVVTLPNFAREEVAFVQSPQHYRNRGTCPVSVGAHESQRVFYELVSPGKNAFDASFHVGTNAVFRRDALDDVGGIYEGSNSEDIWTSLSMHQAGWSSVYVGDILARGLAADTVHTYLKQQFRWASGSFEILLRNNPLFARGLTLDQRIQYLLAPMHYLQSFAMFLFLLLPAMFLLFDVQPIETGGTTWLLRYAPFLIISQIAVFSQLGRFHWWSMALALAAAPVHIWAFFNVLIGRQKEWAVSNRDDEVASVIDIMPVQIALMLINIAAIFVGLFVFENPFATIISLALCIFYAAMLGSVVLEAIRDGRRPIPNYVTTNDDIERQEVKA